MRRSLLSLLFLLLFPEEFFLKFFMAFLVFEVFCLLERVMIFIQFLVFVYLLIENLDWREFPLKLWKGLSENVLLSEMILLPHCRGG